MSTTTTITSTFRVHGMHNWADAPEEVGYLRHPHRHEFIFRVKVRVYHDDRDVEFHMLQAQCKRLLAREYPNMLTSPSVFDFGGRSCETLGHTLGRCLQREGVDVQSVAVWEDDENGAEVSFVALGNDPEFSEDGR